MSRVGRMPIPVPAGVTVTVDGARVSVQGPKGQLVHQVPPGFAVVMEEQRLLVRAPGTARKETRALYGLTRSLLWNVVEGVSRGFRRELALEGVGFRAQLSGRTLEMQLGFSHPVRFVPPPGITIEVPKPERVVVGGADRLLVGQVAARIRSCYPPEPYKGKGIRYLGEVIRRKAGKTVA